MRYLTMLTCLSLPLLACRGAEPQADEKVAASPQQVEPAAPKPTVVRMAPPGTTPEDAPAPKAAEGGPTAAQLRSAGGTLRYEASGGRSPIAKMTCELRWGADGAGARVDAAAEPRLKGATRAARESAVEPATLDEWLGVVAAAAPLSWPEEVQGSSATDLFTYQITMELAGRQHQVKAYSPSSGPTHDLLEMMDRACAMDELVKAARAPR